jgi:glucan endo-1,3-alpha-glucosidase
MKSLYLSTALLSLLAVPAGSRAATPHYVFAHYMVCYATYGETVSAYEREIQEAQAAGLDGFALNVGGWNNSETYYKRRVALMYDAAEQLGTGFKLFFSVDYNADTNNDVVDMVQTYAQRTNTFRLDGKVVLSTYTRNWVDWPGIRSQLAAKGVDTFFIPYLLSIPVHELPTYADAASILSTNRWRNYLDGFFLWVAAGMPEQLAQCNADYGRACREAGKVFMASCSPHFWGCAQGTLGRRYYESQGGEEAAVQWASIITNQPDWVELCTWNDFNESTYISPVDDPGKYFANIQRPRRYCHAGYLELYKHYIAWYKTGVEPPIDRDALFYFYRTHPKNAAASDTNDVPVRGLVGDVEDLLYTTVRLIAPAQLEILSGPTSCTNLLGEGTHHVRAPFMPGAQKMVLRRSGKEVLSVQGPDIASAIQVYDFFPASGFAYGSELRATARDNLRFTDQSAGLHR